jgi:hypothetical protein
MLLLSVLTDFQTMSDLAHGVFAMGVANVSLLGAIGTAFAVRHRRFGRE